MAQHRAIAGSDPGGLVHTVVTTSFGTDLLVGGEFRGAMSLGSYPVVLESIDEPGFERLGGDLWLARISDAGSVRWARQIGGSAFDSGLSAASWADGIAVTGRFHESIDLGGGMLTAVDGPGVMPGFAGDVFVAMLDPDGNHLWSRAGGGLVSDTPADIAVSASGDVTVVGSFGRRTNLGGSDLVSRGGGDGFVVRYTATGTHVWSVSLGGVAGDAALAVDTDDRGFIAVGGFVEGEVDLGGGALNAWGGVDGFVGMFDRDSQHVWSVTLGGTGRDVVTNVALYGQFVVVVGTFEDQLLPSAETSSGKTDAFIAWLDASTGVLVRAIALGGATEDGAACLAIKDSTAYVGGYFTGAADLGGEVDSSGGIDGFVARTSQ